jgi:hypothetical protein
VPGHFATVDGGALSFLFLCPPAFFLRFFPRLLFFLAFFPGFFPWLFPLAFSFSGSFRRALRGVIFARQTPFRLLWHARLCYSK